MSHTGDLLDVKLTALRGKARHIDVDDLTRVRVVLNSLVGVVRVCTEGVRAEELLLLLHVWLGRLGDLRVFLLGVLIDVPLSLVMVEAVLVEVRSQLVLRDSLAGVGLEPGVALARLIREPVHRGGDDASVGFPGRSAAWWPIRPMAPVIKIYLLFIHRFHVGVVRLGQDLRLELPLTHAVGITPTTGVCGLCIASLCTPVGVGCRKNALFRLIIPFEPLLVQAFILVGQNVRL